MNKLPELWFRKTHLETGSSFEDVISNKNCPSWDKTPFCQLNEKAQARIDELNTKMPCVYHYEIIGWRVE